jgi:hypothetical protein
LTSTAHSTSSLLSAPPPQAEYQGFGLKGSLLGLGVFLVISVLSYLLVTYFQKVNKKKNEISIAKKKAADAKIFAGAADDDFSASSLTDNARTGLLSR